ncbi:phenol hydroxylase [Pseudomonas sp. S31]|uniref:phenol hydroxylase subunit P4 n=1 Tax=Pseudomonas sp. S31 TaxID=1564473 RepID=UPI001912171D|nr:phenol hydroxylase subunit P4 [Pseudomonas sp. S31]MBK5001668.1 phenol hydroxylase [Pseudomonas sp. S31]
MPVAAITDYIAVPRDRVENFNGKQLLYVSWDRHLLFGAPFLFCVPPTTNFRELVEGPLTALLQADPDAAALDWESVQWLREGQPWTPDWNASLVSNGLTHKDQLRFISPGLNSLCGEGGQ